MQPALAHIGARDELGELLVEPEPRILEIDRLDGVPRHGHLDPHLRDDRLVMEADHARLAAARPPVVDAVQIDETHRFARPVRVGHARPEPAGDEGQVRVAVAGLDGALGGVEILAAIQPVVRVPGALREDLAEGLDVGGMWPGAQPLIRLRSRNPAVVWADQ